MEGGQEGAGCQRAPASPSPPRPAGGARLGPRERGGERKVVLMTFSRNVQKPPSEIDF